jgi:hypothetical protein
MVNAPRPILAALALSGAAFGMISRGGAQTALPKSSPFMSANAPAAANAPGETIEFAAVRTIGKRTEVDLYDTQGKKNHWIPLGGTADGMTVVNYDVRRDQVTATIGGVNKLLTLRRTRGTAAGNAAVTTQAAMSFATPDTTFVQKMPPPAPEVTATPAAAAPAADANATTAAPATTPVQPAVPLTIARQEEEARMLVSDLLEIGMAQRKAYEEKQKKAADPNAAATPETPPAATPAPTQKPDGTPNGG